MLARVWSATLVGIDAIPLAIEIDVSPGLPNFQIVGLPDAAVKESRERVRAALRNTGRDLPPRSIVVNLAPADLRKEGSALDLGMALGLLAALGELPADSLAGRLVAGELALDGALRPVPGALSLALLAAKEGWRELLVPAGSVSEAAAARRVDAVGLHSLGEAIAHLKGERVVEPFLLPRVDDAAPPPSPFDLADVRGQAFARRALEVAAAGGHNLLMVGPPGTGKTMIARRLPGILPPLADDEAIAVTRIHSVAGLPPGPRGLVSERPFRSPHTSVSGAGLVGGGRTVQPGEVSLAHAGVLFLDELPEFRRDVLDLLRQPLEDGEVSIVRATRRVVYPCRFSLVAAMNPCPCGWRGHPVRPCRCSPHEVSRYVGRISGPLLDRIDLVVEVPAPSADDLGSGPGESTASVRVRVIEARQRQRQRLGGDALATTNAGLPPAQLARHARPTPEAMALLEGAVRRLGLSARGHGRVLRVARTLADLAGDDAVATIHVAEALQYRALDRTLGRGTG